MTSVGGYVRPCVKDARTGDPVKNALVTVYYPEGVVAGTGATDPAGCVDIPYAGDVGPLARVSVYPPIGYHGGGAFAFTTTEGAVASPPVPVWFVDVWVWSYGKSYAK